MLRVESNMTNVLQSLIIQLDEGFPIQTEKALRKVGDDAKAYVQDRVQQRGDGVNGRIQTKAQKTFGAYSKGWGKHRDTKGRQTSHIDLTFSGELWLSWQTLSSSPKMTEIGFAQSEQGDKAEYLEAYFGPIFSLTKEEETEVLATFEEEFNKEMQLI